MNLRIRNEHGQWYKGDGEWGPTPDVVEVYDGIDNLPETITDSEGKSYKLLILPQVFKGRDILSYAGYYDCEEEDSDWCYARIEWC